MKDESLKILMATFLECYTKKQMISLFKTERDKKIGLFLYQKGYEDAMNFCMKRLDKVK